MFVQPRRPRPHGNALPVRFVSIGESRLQTFYSAVYEMASSRFILESHIFPTPQAVKYFIYILVIIFLVLCIF